jgi:hypothetical protein
MDVMRGPSGQLKSRFAARMFLRIVAELPAHPIETDCEIAACFLFIAHLVE